MKSLKEQVSEVMTSQLSNAEKRVELIKLGLRGNDIAVLFALERAARPTREHRDTLARLINNYTFGVEIECYNAPRTNLVSAMNVRGLRVNDIRSYHDAHSGSYANAYRLVPDGSINGYDGVECVTPILKGNKGFNSIKECCDALNEIGALVNRSTGLHIHVGGEITERQYVNTFVNYYYLENVIDSFMPDSRQDNCYCMTLRETRQSSQRVNIDRLLSAQTFGDVLSAFHYDRYYKINATSWARHNTIEFRQHAGTTNYEKISMWAKFCLKLVVWSAENRLSENVTNIEDIPFLTNAEKTYFSRRLREIVREAE